jgi:hypothetical protein
LTEALALAEDAGKAKHATNGAATAKASVN